MPDFSTLALFAAAALALAVTPGPDMLLVASRSLSQGRKAAFATLAGIQAGIYVHATALALGLSELFVRIPWTFDAVRWAGAAYLLWLAFRIWRTREQTPLATTNALPATPTWLTFRQGLITNVLNPKVALFMLALLPQFVHPASGGLTVQILILATILNLIGFTVNGTIVLLVGTLRQRLGRRFRTGRASQYFLAAVFSALALRLAFSGRAD